MLLIKKIFIILLLLFSESLFLLSLNNNKCSPALSSTIMSNYLDNNYIKLIQAHQNDLLKDLLEEDPSIALKHTNDDKKRTMLHFAVHYQNLELIKLLLTYTIAIDSQDSLGATALHYAATEEGPENIMILSLLLEHHAQLDMQDNNGETPLHYASSSENNNHQTFAFLISHYTDITLTDNNGNTPLHTAVMYKNSFAVKKLICAGANVNRANIQGHTPLYYAVMQGNQSLVEYLIAAGGDILQKQAGRPIIFVAIEFCEPYQTGIITLLIEKGADIYSQYKQFTPIRYAKKNNKPLFVELLKQKIADECRQLAPPLASLSPDIS